MATGSGIFDIPNIGDSPCVNCKERSIGCHSICEDYISWRNLLDASKKLYLRHKKENKVIYKGEFLGDEGLMSNSKFRSIKKRYKR